MSATSVTSKGQVTIPHDVRHRLGIRQGSRIAFKVVGDHAELEVVEQPAKVRGSGFGMFKTDKPPAPPDLDPATLLQPQAVRRSKAKLKIPGS